MVNSLTEVVACFRFVSFRTLVIERLRVGLWRETVFRD